MGDDEDSIFPGEKVAHQWEVLSQERDGCQKSTHTVRTRTAVTTVAQECYKCQVYQWQRFAAGDPGSFLFLKAWKVIGSKCSWRWKENSAGFRAYTGGPLTVFHTCSQHFPGFISFNLHNKPMWYLGVLAWLCRWGVWGTQGLGNLPKATQALITDSQ